MVASTQPYAVRHVLRKQIMTSIRATARVVGILFLSAFILYGVGSSIATTAEPGSPALILGIGMMLLNSIAVIAIGVLLLPVVWPHSPRVAIAYLVSRIVEGIALGTGAIALGLGAAGVNVVAYNLGMTVLGVGSVFLCIALYRHRLVPRWLAAWGAIGYAIFALGSVLELAGVAGAGLVGAAPGGLFEVTFGVWLIVRGFRADTVRQAATPPTEPYTPRPARARTTPTA